MLFEQISADIVSAMKAKDKLSLQVLRTIKKNFLEAKTAPGAHNELSDADALRIIQKLIKQGKDSASIYAEQNRQDLADEELAQVEVLEKYQPQQLSQEELTSKIKEIVERVGASTMKDMGKVMGLATTELAGKAEGKAISNKVKELLG